MAQYDLTDPQVAALVRNTHTPIEIAVDGSAMDAIPVAPVAPRVLTMICARDHETWPCAVATELRALDTSAKLNSRAQQQGGGQGGNRTPIPTAADQALANRRG